MKEMLTCQSRKRTGVNDEFIFVSLSRLTGTLEYNRTRENSLELEIFNSRKGLCVAFASWSDLG